jgi:formate hydrogenlyase transcriptional activator
VILSKGPILNVPLSELIEVDQRYLDDGSEESNMLTFHRPPRTERDLIVKALNETGGVIAGPKGAAAKLGLKRSTLISRMKRLGL